MVDVDEIGQIIACDHTVFVIDHLAHGSLSLIFVNDIIRIIEGIADQRQ